MAEAHQAVAFQFAIDPEGEIEIHVDWFLARALYLAAAKKVKRRYALFLIGVQNGVYPVKPITWVIFVALASILYQCGIDGTFGFRAWFCSWPVVRDWNENVQLAASTIVWGSILYKCYSILLRTIMKRVLAYKGWIHVQYGKVRLIDKIWHGIVSVLAHRNPKLFSIQNCLPHLPVPPIGETVERYLRSVKPLQSAEQYARTVELSHQFRRRDGFKLQIWLWLKWLWSKNYVSDWWEQYVYLAGRAPIMVNSNYYGVDALRQLTQNQAARAANLVHYCLSFRLLIEKQELSPCFVNKTVPMCSWQYQRQFSTTRIPGKDYDHIVTASNSQHIVVYHRGRWFRVAIMQTGRLFSPAELQRIFEVLMSDPTPPDYGEAEVASLTAWRRDHWFQARQFHFRLGPNRNSLDVIETAAFVVALDDEEYYARSGDVNRLNHFTRMMLHGDCQNRWFDKTFTLVIGKNAVAGFNAEHSWADAPIMAHLWEYVLAHDLHIVGYRSNGDCNGSVRIGFKPQHKYRKLQWEITETCMARIKTAQTEARMLADSVDLYVLMFEDFGKGTIKKCRVSPDAFCQMALQLAQFRDQKKFCLTYEAAMTRVFVQGRTETVRSCTIESCDFVRSMDDPNKTREDRRVLLKKACDGHQILTRHALVGDGIDRHLFSLYVVSKVLGIKSQFLEEIINEPWRLSTSQTPTNQSDLVNFDDHVEMMSGGGGFGPVADDGYGVSYIICGTSLITFHVSSKKTCTTTNSDRFAMNIKRAMTEMAALFDT